MGMEAGRVGADEAPPPTGGAPGASGAIAIPEIKRAEPVDFAKDILPIFRDNCIACHNATDHEAELSVETPAALLKGGDSGPSVIAGKGAESLLLQVSARLEKPFMPPKNNKVGAKQLTPEQLGLLKLWIDQGAKDSAPPAVAPPVPLVPTPANNAKVEYQPLPEGLNPIYAVAVTQDGQLAACNRANQIFVYSLPTRSLLTRLTDPRLLDSIAGGRPGVAHRDLIQSLAFSPDGKLLASGGYREVKLWQRPDPAVRFTLPGVAGKRVGTLAVSPDGGILAAGSDEGVIRLFNLPDGKPRAELKGHTGEVTSVRFSDDGTQLYSGSGDKTIRVWNVTDGSPAGVVNTPQPISAVLAMQPAKDAPRVLVSAGGDALIRTWAMPAATPVRDVADAPAGPVTLAATSPDRKRVAVAGADNTVRLIDVANAKAGASVATHGAAIRAMGFDGTGNLLLSASEDGTTAMTNVEAEPKAVASFPHPAGALSAAAMSRDGKLAVTATGDGRVTLWRLDAAAPRVLGAKPDEAPATVMAASANGQWLASAGTSGGKPAVIVRDLASGEVKHTLLGAEGPIGAIAFNPDASRIVAACGDKTARTWTLADGKESAKFAGHGAALTAVAFHGDGARVVTGAADGSVKVWNAADGKEIRSLPASRGAIVGVAVLPNERLATVSADQTFNVFDLASSTPVRSDVLGASATAMAASRDGARLAIATDDKRLRIIETAKFETLHAVDVPTPIASLSFNADGKRLAATGGERSVIHSADDAKPIELAAAGGAAGAVFADKPGEVIVAGVDKSIRAIPLRFVATLPGFAKRVTKLLFTNDGGVVIGASEDGSIRSFAAADGKAGFVANHGAAIHDLALSPDGQTLVSGGDDRKVKFWGSGDGAAVKEPLKPELGPFVDGVTGVSFTADGKRVIVARANASELRVLDRAGIDYGGVPAMPQPVVAFAPLESPADGGDVVLASSSDKSLKLFRTSHRGFFGGHTGVVASLSPMPGDATRFLSGSADGTVRQWVTGSANPERQFAHGAPVTAVAVRPDGKVIATAGKTFAKLFDAQSAQPIVTLHGDRSATQFAGLTERRLGLAQSEVNIAKVQLDAVNARKAAEVAAITKTEAEKAAAEKVVGEKQTVATAKLAAKAEADKKLADVLASIDAGTKSVAAADTQVASTKATLDRTNAKQSELAGASQKVAGEYQALVKAAEPAKAQSEAAAVEAAAKGKAVADVKAAGDAATAAADAATRTAAEAKLAAEKDPTNQALQEAATAAAKVAGDAASKAKAAAEAVVAAEKASAESSTAATAAAQAYAAARKPAEDAAPGVALAAMSLVSAQQSASVATTAAQKALEAKAAADQALAQAKAAQPGADAAAKQAATEAGNAERELMAANATVASADQSIAGLKSDVAKSDREIVERTATHAFTAAAVVKAQADLDAAKVAAAGADRAIACLAFTPDGATVITAGDDGAVHTYASDTGAASDVLRGHDGAVTALAVRGDGTVLSGSADRTVKAWDVNPAWTLKATLGTGDDRSPLADRVLSLAFSPDGSLLATGGGVPSRSGELKLWSVTTGQLFREFPEAHSDTVFGLSFSGDGKLLASGAADKFARVWNVSTGKLVRSFEGHTHHVLDVGLRYDGRVLVTTGADNAVKLWDVQTGDQRAANNAFSKFEVTSVAHVGFTDRFLVTTGEGLVRILREDMNAEKAFDVPPPGTFLYSGAVTPDGGIVLTGGYDSMLRVRNAFDGKTIADLAPPAPGK